MRYVYLEGVTVHVVPTRKGEKEVCAGDSSQSKHAQRTRRGCNNTRCVSQIDELHTYAPVKYVTNRPVQTSYFAGVSELAALALCLRLLFAVVMAVGCD